MVTIEVSRNHNTLALESIRSRRPANKDKVEVTVHCTNMEYVNRGSRTLLKLRSRFTAQTWHT